MITPFCELPYEVVEVWAAKLLPDVSDFDKYLEEHGSISIGQTTGRGEGRTQISIWKLEEKYMLMYQPYYPGFDIT
jgi:phage antirepressor YoqD-like protein